MNNLNLTQLVEELSAPPHAHLRDQDSPETALPRPSREVIIDIVEKLRAVMFPGFYGDTSELTTHSLTYYIGSVIDCLTLTLLR